MARALKTERQKTLARHVINYNKITPVINFNIKNASYCDLKGFLVVRRVVGLIKSIVLLFLSIGYFCAFIN